MKAFGKTTSTEGNEVTREEVGRQPEFDEKTKLAEALGREHCVQARRITKGLGPGRGRKQ